eukprot:CAMPEP_0196130288 /NCGR_PEP_ID=MMETSP0910-20130528/722_1 /TAXON_ID=49265 /ORGANISM="Thalassiosira rotula, Strain GSO102" /LENGTH=349 /DNA_ID=CAMNT_0041389575 /DNA_START=46 /DNA_END=1095 /DNA_ORIENTATION=-
MMSDSATPIKRTTMVSTMDPPEERKSMHYTLGDVGKPEDMAPHHTYNNLLSAYSFQRGDHCFVLRRSGQFTYAEFLSCDDDDDNNGSMKLQVDTMGSTKSVLISVCTKHVRPLRSMTRRRRRQEQPSSSRSQRRLCQSLRRASDPPPLRIERQSSETNLRRSAPPRGRRASVDPAPSSSSSPRRSPRPSLRRWPCRSDRHPSVRLSTIPKETPSADFENDDTFSSNNENDSDSDIVKTSSSSHDDDDDEPVLTKMIEFISKTISNSNTIDDDDNNAPSSDEESLPVSPPRELVFENKTTITTSVTSVATAKRSRSSSSSSSSSSSLEFNEDYLLTAFQSIVSSAVVPRS